MHSLYPSLPIVALDPMLKRPTAPASGSWHAAVGPAATFTPRSNVGLVTGIEGWVDVDLDSPEAVALAPEWLPTPRGIWGRQYPSGEFAPTHYLYRANPLPESWCRPEMGVELRALAAEGPRLQSVLPPSTIFCDKDGEYSKTPTQYVSQYKWKEQPDFSAPANDAAVDLAVAVRMLALAATAAAMTKNADHQRHDTWLALCGGLTKVGWPAMAIEILVSSACSLYDKDLLDRLGTARSTAARAETGGALKGFGTLKDHWPANIVTMFARAASDVATLEGWVADTEEVTVVSGNFATDNDEIINILTNVEHMFTRSGQLVTIAAKGSGLAIETCTEGNITELATRYGKLRRRTPSGGLEIYTPDARAIRAILERRVWPGLRELLDVVDMPTLRPDGTVIDQEGYDEDTHILYKPRVEKAWAFGNSFEDAQDAVRQLMEPIAEIPFVDALSRSAWLAFVLTLTARSAVRGVVPGYASDASAGNTGKSLAVSVASVIATGHAAATLPFPIPSAVEQLLFSAGASGQRLLFFDNIDRRSAESDAVEGAMTSGSLAQRKFHAQYTIEAPFRCVVAISGNNMEFSPTLGRRFLYSRQVRPANRGDTWRPAIPRLIEWTKERQANLYCAALTILIAHAKAGRPGGDILLGSFEEWSTTIAAALAWLGLPNPIGSRAAVCAPVADTEHYEELAMCLSLYQAKMGYEHEWTSAELFEFIDAPTIGGIGAAAELRQKLLRALTSASPRGRRIESAKAVGETLRLLYDKEIPNLGTLRCRTGHAKTRIWRFVVGTPEGTRTPTS